jgi:hypothetical protein
MPRIKKTFYFIFIAFLFFSGLFWLLITNGLGRGTFVSTPTFKNWLEVCVWASSLLCMYISGRVLLDHKLSGWLIPYIAMLLSAVTVIALIAVTLFFKILWRL